VTAVTGPSAWIVRSATIVVATSRWASVRGRIVRNAAIASRANATTAGRRRTAVIALIDRIARVTIAGLPVAKAKAARAGGSTVDVPSARIVQSGPIGPNAAIARRRVRVASNGVRNAHPAPKVVSVARPKATGAAATSRWSAANAVRRAMQRVRLAASRRRRSGRRRAVTVRSVRIVQNVWIARTERIVRSVRIAQCARIGLIAAIASIDPLGLSSRARLKATAARAIAVGAVIVPIAATVAIVRNAAASGRRCR